MNTPHLFIYPPSPMDVICLAFANDRTNPLPTLQEEDNNLNRILSPRQLKQHFILIRDSYASITSVTNTVAQSKDQLRIFLYSGHAGRDKLLLEGQAANAEGIAYLLGQCPNLQLVFLNGCSTKGQVYSLLQKGIPIVIATSAPIEDKKANEFSSRFFQALYDQCSIKEAYELAKGELMARYPDVQTDASNILAEPGAQAEESLWGLYFLPEKEISLEWKLNANTPTVAAENFVPNELLIDTMMESLSPYREEIKKMVDDESEGATKSILDKREAILRALPHPVSEQFRKLLVDEDPGSGGQTFYNQVGEARLQQIIIIYNTMMELLGFTILADLWEVAASQEKLSIADPVKLKLKEFFISSMSGTSSQKFLDLITTARQIMEAQGKKYFLEELSSLTDTYNAKGQLYDAVSYLEFVLMKIEEKAVPGEEAKEMCIISEQKLAELFRHVGFITNYIMASVKDIDVLKYKRFLKTRYKHNVVKLEQRFVGLAVNTEIEEEALDSNSVLIIKRSDPKLTLNLSPFIIDENAFDDKASIAKLFFFDRYDKASNTYVYKHVYKPLDAPLLIQQQKHFKILRDQFDAFSNAVFQQTLQNL
jgi:hypothetical protein